MSRQSGLLVLLCCVAARIPSAAPAAEEMLEYYDNGRFVAEPRAQAEDAEAEAKAGGHMPWRTIPAFVAAVMGADLLPPQAPGDIAVWENFRTQDDKPAVAIVTKSWRAEYVPEWTDSSRVVLQVNGVPVCTLHLVQPFGHWYYIVDITPAEGPRRVQRAGARGGSIGARAALVPRGFSVRWVADSKTVLVHSRHADASLQCNSAVGVINNRPVTLERPCVVKHGEALLPRAFVSQLISRQMTGLMQASGSASAD